MPHPTEAALWACRNCGTVYSLTETHFCPTCETRSNAPKSYRKGSR